MTKASISSSGNPASMFILARTLPLIWTTYSTVVRRVCSSIHSGQDWLNTLSPCPSRSQSSSDRKGAKGESMTTNASYAGRLRTSALETWLSSSISRARAVL